MAMKPRTAEQNATFAAFADQVAETATLTAEPAAEPAVTAEPAAAPAAPDLMDAGMPFVALTASSLVPLGNALSVSPQELLDALVRAGLVPKSEAKRVPL